MAINDIGTKRIDNLLERFIKGQNPTNDELVAMILRWRDQSGELSFVGERAWKKLQAQKPTVENLMLVFTVRPEECWRIIKGNYFSKAGKIIEHAKIEEEHLRHIVDSLLSEDQEDIRTEAAALLMENFPTNRNRNLLTKWKMNFILPGLKIGKLT